VYDSIAKFLQFQLTVNVSAVSISLLGALVYGEAPLSVVQMLWVNLIMDSLGALALASEQPTEKLLQRPPYGKNKSLISFKMASSILGQSIYQLVILICLLFAGAGPSRSLDDDEDSFVWIKGGIMDIESGVGRHHTPTTHYTLIFNCFVFMQLFNWINCRKLDFEFNVFKGITDNKSFCAIWAACAILQTLFVQAAAIGGGDGENKVFKTRGLDGVQWLVCLGCGLLCMPWQWLVIVVATPLEPKAKIEEVARSQDYEDAECDNAAAASEVALKVDEREVGPDFGPSSSEMERRIGMLEHQVFGLLANRQTRLLKYLREFGSERAQQFGSTADEVLLRSVFTHWCRSVQWATRCEDMRQLEVMLQAKRRRDDLAISRRREMTAVTVSFWGTYRQEKSVTKSCELFKVFLAWYHSHLNSKEEWVNRLFSSSPVGEYAWYILNKALLQDSSLLLAGCFWQMVRQTRHAKRSKAGDLEREKSGDEPPGEGGQNSKKNFSLPATPAPDIVQESTDIKEQGCCTCTNI